MEVEFPDVEKFEFNSFIDKRGAFSRCFDLDDVRHISPNFSVDQISWSTTKKRGTLRGLHFLKEPAQESKYVYVAQGKIQDVVVDVRPASKTLHKYQSNILVEGESLLIPTGYAHGYLTLSDNVILLYAMSGNYVPSLDSGLRFNDPKLAINWAEMPNRVSYRDMNHPLL